MTTPGSTSITLGDIARRYGLPVWKVRRLFERGLLPEPRRIGIYRTVEVADLPVIEAALRTIGYLPLLQPEVSHVG